MFKARFSFMLFAFLLLMASVSAEVFWNETAEDGLVNVWQNPSDTEVSNTSVQFLNGTQSINVTVATTNAMTWSWLSVNLTNQESVNITFAVRPSSAGGQYIFLGDTSGCNSATTDMIGVSFDAGNVNYHVGSNIGTYTPGAWETYLFEYWYDIPSSGYMLNVTRNGTILGTGDDGFGTVNDIGCIAFGGVAGAVFYFDDVLVFNQTGISVDTTPPNITRSTYNVTTSYLNGTVWRIDTTNLTRERDSTFTVEFDLTEVGNCSISLNASNYTEMTSINPDTNCGTTETSNMTCTLPASEALVAGNQKAYIGCIDLAGNEFENSTSGPLNISLDFLMQGKVIHTSDGTDYPGADVLLIDTFNKSVVGNTTSNITGDWNFFIALMRNYTVRVLNLSNSTLAANISAFIEVI